VRGHKIWTSLAHHSEYVYLLARTDPESSRHAGLSELIVPLDATGITITPIHDMSGAHHFNEIFFDDVEVRADALIGEEGKGFYQITAQLGFERAGLERVMSLWPLLVEMRKVADSVDRQRELGRLEAAIAAARQMIYRVAWAADQGKVPDHEAAMAKAFGNRLEQETVELASRWAGRAGRLAAAAGAPYKGHVALAWRIAPSFSIRGGTTEILRGIIARRALGLDS
jgi:alkylation response protein AidB-like acyl-CoA dehydrogenase